MMSIRHTIAITGPTDLDFDDNRVFVDALHAALNYATYGVTEVVGDVGDVGVHEVDQVIIVGRESPDTHANEPLPGVEAAVVREVHAKCFKTVGLAFDQLDPIQFMFDHADGVVVVLPEPNTTTTTDPFFEQLVRRARRLGVLRAILFVTRGTNTVRLRTEAAPSPVVSQQKKTRRPLTTADAPPTRRQPVVTTTEEDPMDIVH
jgi:hypothetical protein